MDIDKDRAQSDIALLCSFCLKISNILDRFSDEDVSSYDLSKELGYSPASLSNYLRTGVQQIIDLQNQFSNSKALLLCEKKGIKRKESVLSKIFGESTFYYNIEDSDLKKINKYVEEEILSKKKYTDLKGEWGN
jgi:predicted transcriptional regulator